MNFKFYKFVPIILLCPLLIIGQEFDQAFLDSLPEEIAEDLKHELMKKLIKKKLNIEDLHLLLKNQMKIRIDLV